MRSNHSVKGPLFAVAALSMFVAVSVLATTPSDGALNAWRAPMKSFQYVGELIGREDFKRARAELNADATNFSAPYGAMAAEYAGKLDSALTNFDSKDSKHLGELAELCTGLRACDAALRLQPEGGKKDKPNNDNIESAWRLWETGDTKAALVAYHRKLEAEPIEAWQNYWSEQIRLIEISRTNRNKVEFALELVRQRYLKGFEVEPDYFGALEHLTSTMPYARTEDEKVALDLLVIKTLDSAHDETGRTAWEDKVLEDFKTNKEACAGIYLGRGIRTFKKQDLTEATPLFRKICSDYSDTQAYGDAQYALAVILQQQQSYDESITQYARLFQSRVDDYAKPADDKEDYKCYRFRAALGISDCYEAKGDYLHALEYAELARDHYKFMSTCQSCVTETNQTVKARIAQLENKIKVSGPASDAHERADGAVAR
jgi:tetratricopeptide (TPR) repeat protein